MTIDHARRLASTVVMKLRPYCDSIEVVGEIQENKPRISKLEIKCVPQLTPLPGEIDKFERSPGFVKAVRLIGGFKSGKPDSANFIVRSIDTRDYPSIPEESIDLEIKIA